MDKFKCRRGWLLAKSPTDNKTLVPYFVKVRSGDIVWNKSSFPDDIDKYITFKDNGYTITPHVHIEFYDEDTGWHIKLFPNYRYEATNRINIRKNFEISEYGTAMLVSKIKLPYITYNDTSLTTNMIISSSDVDLSSSSIVLNLPSIESTNIIEELEVRLVNEIRNFDNNYKGSPFYDKSELLITLSGNINTEAYD